ncbi:MAG: class I SAM-dependent methyltransferase [Myxococcales bacterium]|nr:class I SAM-dependent methyltransferase [Myxococcales bacterium]
MDDASDSLELSDLLVRIDPRTFERGAIRRAELVNELDRVKMRQALRIVRDIPGTDELDGAYIDQMFLRSHRELQRLSQEFGIAARVSRLLTAMVASAQEAGHKSIEVVEVGCGIGYLTRWLAAYANLPEGVSFIGYDFNRVLVEEATTLAQREKLPCLFHTQNAFAPAEASGARIYISSSVLHHFRGSALDEFFRRQQGSVGFLHADIKRSWAAPVGAWLFHIARMREPLARHDGYCSARRAHAVAVLANAARQTSLHTAILDGAASRLPILRAWNWGIGMRPNRYEGFQSRIPQALGARMSVI